jgi:DNA-binding SARP family transcriptional activator/TolB-like protein
LRLRTFGGLWIERPGAESDTAARPRTLALLAILATADAAGITRERVMAVLWPEADEDRARHALSQALYNLRRDLGDDIVLSTPALRLDPALISSDVADFQAAVAAKSWETAAALYAGPFLDGFHLADGPEFERWAESQRATFATAGIRAIEILAKAAAEAGELGVAAEHWHRLTQLDPADPRLAASYMQMLAALGDRAAAIAHGRAHAELIRREYEAEPHGAIGRLMNRLSELHVTGSHQIPPARVSIPRPSPHAPAADTSRGAAGDARDRAIRTTTSVPRRALVVAALAGVALAAAIGWRWTQSPRPATRPVLAVGAIRDLAAPESAAVARVLREMFSTDLGRLSDVQVVANSRMLELTPRDADTSRTAFSDAARRAGAAEVIEGELIPLGDGRLRLEVRRVDVASGLVRGGYHVSGSDRVALLDSVTALIAADLRVPAPNTSVAEVSTRSPVAYRLYEEGLRALYQFHNVDEANRLLREAIREDSTFVAAAYHTWRIARSTGQPDEALLAEHVLALASRASPRDRLLVVTHVGAERSDPRAVAAAESLATSYPRDPEALVRAGEVVPNLSRAISLLDRAIALDSTAGSGRGETALCRLCEAFAVLTSRYEWADSGVAVERTLRRWRSMQANDTRALELLAEHFISLGRRTEAEAALREYDRLGGRVANVHFTSLVTDIRLDDLDAADRACSEGLAGTDDDTRAQYRWYCVIALRMEGRFREARALASDGRSPWPGARRPLPLDPYEQASVDLDGGAPLVAAREFRAILSAADTARMPEGARARQNAWLLTLTATASAAGGDTLRARALVDSIERFGARSGFRRDPSLHHFVRGLLEAAARHDDAAVREYRAAMDSPTYGYTRINYELARSLLALRRPAEAIPVVQGALRGGIEGSNLYVTRTALHELLAQLFDAAGQRDSAAAHYAIIERAWRSADPMLRPRYEAAQRWLRNAASALGASESGRGD